MDTIDIGYREVPFRVKNVAHILASPELLEKLPPDSEAALQEFHAYCGVEKIDDDTFFCLTLAPSASMASALREVIRVLELAKRGGCKPFDDSAVCQASRFMPMQ